MTRSTPAGAGEKGFTGLGIADQDIEDLIQASVGGQVDCRVQKTGEIGHLRVSQIELRHPLVGPADSQERPQLPSLFVVLHDGRPRQVGSTLSTAGVGTVTEAALLDEQLTSAIDCLLIEALDVL
jgi:hypothetical protein